MGDSSRVIGVGEDWVWGQVSSSSDLYQSSIGEGIVSIPGLSMSGDILRGEGELFSVKTQDLDGSFVEKKSHFNGLSH